MEFGAPLLFENVAVLLDGGELTGFLGDGEQHSVSCADAQHTPDGTVGGICLQLVLFFAVIELEEIGQ